MTSSISRSRLPSLAGAKSNSSPPFVDNRRVYPGDPPNDLGIDSAYYHEVERHRDVAHVFVLGGDLEPRVSALLRRTGYRRLVSGRFAIWLPPGA